MKRGRVSRFQEFLQLILTYFRDFPLLYERNGPKLRKKSITIHGKLVTNQAANQPIKQTNKINEQTSKQTETKQSEVN